MTAAAFRAALKRLNLTQVWIAEVTGKDAVTVNRWAHGRLDVPPYAATIIKLIEHVGVDEARRIINGERK